MLHIKFRKIPLLLSYYLTKFDDVILSGFWVIPKITSANLWKPIHDIELSRLKEAKKLQKFEYLEN